MLLLIRNLIGFIVEVTLSRSRSLSLSLSNQWHAGSRAVPIDEGGGGTIPLLDNLASRDYTMLYTATRLCL